MKKILKPFILILIIIFLTNYIFNIINYPISNTKQKKIDKLSDKIKITNLITYTYNKPINTYKYKNIKLNNFLDEFNCTKSNNELKCSKQNIIFKLSKEETLYTKLKNYNIKKIKGKTIINDNNIKDDLGVLSLIKSTKNFNKYLSNKNTLKQTYLLENFALKYIINFKTIDIINGKYQGYIYNIDKNKKIVIITKNNINYKFIFKNLDYFNNDLINDIISSVTIKGA